MFARCAATLALVAVAAAAPAEPPSHSGREAAAAVAGTAAVASYRIDAKLDPATRRISGQQELTWRNAAATPATTLQFHLYYNAWRNSASTWLRERRLLDEHVLDGRGESDWGWIDITRLRVSHAGRDTDLTASLRFVAPDDGNPEDRTVAEVPLAIPVAPGDTASIAISWTSRVPRTFSRTGVRGNYYFVAQWFPKIGVFDDAGWNTHQFHATTEFFSDFGTYDVRLTVPRGWLVGATGSERERRELADGTTSHRYYQEHVHDFAWTTSPDYIERTGTFSHPTLPGVRLRLLLQPEHRRQERRHFDAVRAALKAYGEWYGAYPYGHLTIVDPAWQSGAGGMEYPTLITAGTSWLAPRAVAQPESVTIHEVGHQFWYGVVATNEFEHAWMDEGFNTFSTTRVLADTFGPDRVVRRYFDGFVPWVFHDLSISRSLDTRSAASYRGAMPGDAPSQHSWRYWPRSAAGTTYHKTALWLHTLERHLGWDTVQRILATYFERWSFRHPAPQDFFAIASEVSGQDLTWFFDQVHASAAVFDYGVERLRSEPAGPRGYAGDGAPRAFVARPAGGAYRTTVVVRRYGDGVFPVDVRVVLENGEAISWQWDGRERWKQFEVERPVRAVRADVDPRHVLLLDVNTTNNSALLAPDGARRARGWSLLWLMWLQDHLMTYGFLV